METLVPVLLAAPTLAGWEAFMQGLMDAGAQVHHVRGGLAALERVTLHPPVLLVADEGLADLTPLQLVGQLVRINAAVNAAAVSTLPGEQFHEAFEGLGVLAQLPPQPGAREARELMAALRGILSPGTIPAS